MFGLITVKSSAWILGCTVLWFIHLFLKEETQNPFQEVQHQLRKKHKGLGALEEMGCPKTSHLSGYFSLPVL